MKFNYKRFLASLIINCFLLFALGNLISSGTAYDIDPKDGPKKLTAVVEHDNDLPLEREPKGEQVDVPKVVQLRIDKIAHTAFESWKKAFEGTGDPPEYFQMKLNDVYGIVVRIDAPSNRKLFVFQENGLFGSIFYHLMLFDPHTNVVTPNPPRINGKWMQGGHWGAKLLEPLISFDDLDQDGEPEVVVQEKVHNGTMYNAVVYHYFKIGSDMSLNRILALETRLIDLYTEDVGGLITRKVIKMAPNQIKLETSLEVERQEPEELGEVTLIRNGGYSPFLISNRQMINTKYKDFLITGSGKDENEFLKTGYDFYY